MGPIERRPRVHREVDEILNRFYPRVQREADEVVEGVYPFPVKTEMITLYDMAVGLMVGTEAALADGEPYPPAAAQARDRLLEAIHPELWENGPQRYVGDLYEKTTVQLSTQDVTTIGEALISFSFPPSISCTRESVSDEVLLRRAYLGKFLGFQKQFEDAGGPKNLQLSTRVRQSLT